MGRFVYTVCNGLKLVAEGVPRENWWIDPTTGHPREKALYMCEQSAYCGFQPDEIKGSSIYTCERMLEYPLTFSSRGDWHSTLEKMVGYERGTGTYPDDFPFIELLDDRYSEATFGPTAVRKIVADFDAWKDRASKVTERVEIWEEDKTAEDWYFSKPRKLACVEYVPNDEFYLTYWYLRCCFGHAVKEGVVIAGWEM